MTDYRIDIKIRNNVFLHRLEQAGYKSVGELCRLSNLMKYASSIGAIVNMTESPFQSNGNWKKPILWAAEKLNCAPEDLFNESQLSTIIKSNKRCIKVNEAEMKFMLGQNSQVKSLEDQYSDSQLSTNIENILNSLTPREKKVIEMRMGLGEYSNEHTLEEVSQEMGVTRERIRQTEAKALRKLRHPDRNNKISTFLYEDEA